MKGVVLAGGKGTRLLPLTDPVAKEMLPVYHKPMIIHAIEALISGGVHEIAVVVHCSTVKAYKHMLSKFKLDCNITFFAEQQRAGPGQALLLVESWVNNSDFAVILGDSLFFNQLPPLPHRSAPHLFVMEMCEQEDDLRKYGQVQLSDSRVIDMRWKPEQVFSQIIQTTVFLFPSSVFEKIRPLSQRQETHISDLTAQYIAEGLMTYTLLPRESYLDCGSVEALFQASVRVRTQQLRITKVSNNRP